MTGIVLCGGQSLRMGSDKGLLVHEAKTWAQTAFEKLSSLKIETRFSVNQQQLIDYAKVFATEEQVAHHPTLSIHGPLLGVLSSAMQYKGKDLFVLACDLPLMEISTLRELYAHYQNEHDYEAYIYINDGEAEPLCGIYTAKGLEKIIALNNEGKLVKHSMKFVLSQLDVYKIPLTKHQKQQFRNFNAHAELNGL